MNLLCDQAYGHTASSSYHHKTHVDEPKLWKNLNETSDSTIQEFHEREDPCLDSDVHKYMQKYKTLELNSKNWSTW